VNVFRQTFRRVTDEVAVDGGLRPLLTKGGDRDLLVIPKQRPDGFEVRLECYDYGVYPSAGGWHGGCWDVTIWEPEELARSLREFISSVLTDAVLLVHESNGKPYKWVLEHQYEGERVCSKTGFLFFNWFGRRAQRRYSNGYAS
jgi:hypothetical protein